MERKTVRDDYRPIGRRHNLNAHRNQAKWWVRTPVSGSNDISKLDQITTARDVDGQESFGHVDMCCF